jgi:hypothetical protein
VNTNQGKDGNIGGMKMLTTKSGRPKEPASFQDCNWTTLGWVAATGEHVMCTIIIPGKWPSNDEITGFNTVAQLDKKIVLDRENPDPIFEDADDKVYPMDPTCIYTIKAIPTFIAIKKWQHNRKSNYRHAPIRGQTGSV